MTKSKKKKYVKYLGTSHCQVGFGGCNDSRRYLDVGQTYEVVKMKVHAWHTKYHLKGFEGLVFNSVCFEDCENVSENS